MVDLEKLNDHFALHSYLGSTPCATIEDYECCQGINPADLDVLKLHHVQRWHSHISFLIAKYGLFDSLGRPIPENSSSVWSRLKTSSADVKAAAPQEPSVAQPAKQPKAAKQPKQQPAAKETMAAAPSLASKVTHFCVLDFEKTCEKDVQLEPQEIIEFPSVLLSRSPIAKIEEFKSYVKPTVHPELTAFCTKLTGITQEQVDGAPPLVEVLGQHHKWLGSLVPDDERCIFVTCGDMDLKNSLPKDPNIVAEDLPGCYRRWLNIKKEFGLFYTQWYPKKGKQPRNMTEMLEKLEIHLEGQHHSGIDDCRNIAKVLEKMLAAGWCPV